MKSVVTKTAAVTTVMMIVVAITAVIVVTAGQAILQLVVVNFTYISTEGGYQ